MKKVKSQSLRKQYENFNMKNNEKGPCVLALFSYESTRVVPGRYDPIVYMQGQVRENRPLVINEPIVTTIVGQWGPVLALVHAYNKMSKP